MPNARSKNPWPSFRFHPHSRMNCCTKDGTNTSAADRIPLLVFWQPPRSPPHNRCASTVNKSIKTLAAVRSCPPCNKAPRAQRGLSLCLPGMTLIGSSLCLYLCLPLREEKEDEHLPSDEVRRRKQIDRRKKKRHIRNNRSEHGNGLAKTRFVVTSRVNNL